MALTRIARIEKIHIFRLFPCPLADAWPQQAVSCHTTPTHPAKEILNSKSHTHTNVRICFLLRSCIAGWHAQIAPCSTIYIFYTYACVICIHNATHTHTHARALHSHALVTISVQLVIRHIRASSSIKSNTFHYLPRFTCCTCHTCRFILYIAIFCAPRWLSPAVRIAFFVLVFLCVFRFAYPYASY